MAVMYPEPVGQFYEAPAKLAAKKKGREHTYPLKCHAHVISKHSSKTLRIGKRSKGNRIDDYPLLATLTNPNFNPTLFEELDVKEDDLHLLVGDNWCLHKFLLICFFFFVFSSQEKTN